MADWSFGFRNPEGLRRLVAWYGYPWAWCARYEKVRGALSDVLTGRDPDWLVKQGEP